MQLTVPDRMPLDGLFAETASASSSIYYYTPKWTAWNLSSTNTKVFGLYRFDASGGKWALLSTDYDFTQLYAHDDKTIYAIAAITEKKENETIFYDRILRSTDSGEHWEDISHDMVGNSMLCRIFQDPDHKELVCLSANSLRSYVLQADDKNYKWKYLREEG